MRLTPAACLGNLSIHANACFQLGSPGQRPQAQQAVSCQAARLAEPLPAAVRRIQPPAWQGKPLRKQRVQKTFRFLGIRLPCRTWCLPLVAAFHFALPIARAEIDWNDSLPPDWSYEAPSPQERQPATIEPGLRRRAIPREPAADESQPVGENLELLTKSFSTRMRENRGPYQFGSPDGGGGAFVEVEAYRALLGLQPRIYRPGTIEFYPWFGISQSYETNVTLTSTNPQADFYVTPRAGLEIQLGTPDSIYNESYDTILALHGLYEAYADIFYLNPSLSAFNERLELNGRIGRAGAIWRPFVSASDLTGSNLLMAELVNRARRVRVQTGVNGEYQFTETTGWNQSFSYFLLEHPEDGYINYAVWREMQELTYRVFHDMRALVWVEYRYTQPDQGSSGNEVISGLGWAGKPDPRIYTELRVGWDELRLSGSFPGRKNLSGIRFNGYTTFDWGPRFRPTFRYDRDYVFNEVDVDDNYVSTLLQLKGEIFLGGNWYITPYLGCSLQEYETSNRVTLQYRPEIEVSYAFGDGSEPNKTNVFIKTGYTKSQNISGPGAPVEDFRVSIGGNWKF